MKQICGVCYTFPLILDKTKTQIAVEGTQWQATDKLLFSLLDQPMEPQDTTPIELQYDTHHMGDIGIDFLREYVEKINNCAIKIENFLKLLWLHQLMTHPQENHNTLNL